MEVEDANAFLRDDGADGLEGGAVVRLLVLAVLHELARQDVLLELQPRDEVVILPVNLVGAPRPGCVCREENMELSSLGSISYVLLPYLANFHWNQSLNKEVRE